jgi:hypothetical protein
MPRLQPITRPPAAQTTPGPTQVLIIDLLLAALGFVRRVKDV